MADRKGILALLFLVSRVSLEHFKKWKRWHVDLGILGASMDSATIFWAKNWCDGDFEMRIYCLHVKECKADYTMNWISTT